MAKDRARDPKRVPSLNIGEPKSHVRVTSQGGHSDAVRHMKLDAFGQTDEMRHEDGMIDRALIGYENSIGAHGVDEPIKINTDPTKKK
jgi:hypothetical protein